MIPTYLALSISFVVTGTANPSTVSIGITAMRQGEDWATWLKRADQALYRAKQSGQNRLVTEELAACG